MQIVRQNYAINVDTDYVLAINKMSKVLSGGGAAFHLDIPEFRLRRGGFFGLVGRSGSGKSTLLDLLAMVMKPTRIERYDLTIQNEESTIEHIAVAGYIGTDGLVNKSKAQSSWRHDNIISSLRSNHFGYVLQSGGLFQFLTLRENLELPFRMSGNVIDRDRIEALVARFDLCEHLNKKPAGLSGGQRQRASILRALVTKPSILLADEPTAAVDENLAETILNEMRQMASEQGTTVLVVSHDIQLITSHVDQLINLIPRSEGQGVTRTVCRLT